MTPNLASNLVLAAILISAAAALLVTILRGPDAARRVAGLAALIIAGLALAAWQVAIISPADLSLAFSGPAPQGLQLVGPLGPVAAGNIVAVSLAGLASQLLLRRTPRHRVSAGAVLGLEACGIAACAVASLPWTIGVTLVWGGITWLALHAAKPDQTNSASRDFLRLLTLIGVLLAVAATAPALLDPLAAARVRGLALVVAGCCACGFPPARRWVRTIYDSADLCLAMAITAPMLGLELIEAGLRIGAPALTPHVLTAAAAALLCYNAVAAACKSDARDMIACLALAQSALAVLGVAAFTPLGGLGADLARFSMLTSLTALALVVAMIERRTGRVSLDEPRGLQPHFPVLGGLTLLAGFMCIGLPGTIGYLSVEPIATVTAAAAIPLGLGVAAGVGLCGVAVLRLFFALFGGPTREIELPYAMRRSERAATAILAIAILGGTIATFSIDANNPKANTDDHALAHHDDPSPASETTP